MNQPDPDMGAVEALQAIHGQELRLLIKTDGSVATIAKTRDLRALCQLAGMDLPDTVLLADRKHVMLVDDRGYETEAVQIRANWMHMVPKRALKPLNELATALYWEKCGGPVDHRIVGDVIVVPDADFANEDGL